MRVGVARHGDQQAGTVAETEIDRLPGHPGGGRDVAEAHVDPAALHDQPPGGFQHRVAGIRSQRAAFHFTPVNGSGILHCKQTGGGESIRGVDRSVRTLLAGGWRWRCTGRPCWRPRAAGRTGGGVARYLLMLLPLLASVVPVSLCWRGGSGADGQLVYLALVVGDRGLDGVAGGARPRGAGALPRPGLPGTRRGDGGLRQRPDGSGDRERRCTAVGFAVIGIVYGGAMLGELGRPPAPDWWLNWHLNGVSLLFAATHASFIGLPCAHCGRRRRARVHALTQIGTIALAYGLRQWLGRRYQRLAGPAPAGVAVAA